MKTTPRKKRKEKMGDSYFELVREFPLRAIRDDAEHDEAMKVAGRLAIRGEEDLDSGELAYLEALETLLEAYDQKQEPWEKMSGVELLKFLVRENGMTAGELGKIVGSRPAAASILAGKRDISKEMMRRLGAHFRLDPAAFM